MATSADTHGGQTSGIQRPRIVTSVLLLIGVVIAIAGFVAVGYTLAITPLYAGFLLLWFWATVGQASFPALPSIISGAVAGTATAWLLQYCVQAYGAAGLYAVLVLIIVAIFVQIMNWAPLVINAPYMLFLTVTAAPLLQGGEDFRMVIAAILASAAYFAGIVFVGQRAVAAYSRRADGRSGS